MSLYYVQKLIYELNRDPTARKRYESEQDALLQEYEFTDEELEAQPDLVRTMSVQPPKGAGKVRLLDIEGVDLQPCGGTHLKSTGEVGQVRIGKVEKKGRRNRRVNIHLDD